MGLEEAVKSLLEEKVKGEIVASCQMRGQPTLVFLERASVDSQLEATFQIHFLCWSGLYFEEEATAKLCHQVFQASFFTAARQITKLSANAGKRAKIQFSSDDQILYCQADGNLYVAKLSVNPMEYFKPQGSVTLAFIQMLSRIKTQVNDVVKWHPTSSTVLALLSKSLNKLYLLSIKEDVRGLIQNSLEDPVVTIDLGNMANTSFESFSFANTGTQEDLTVFSVYLLNQLGSIYLVGPILLPNHVYSDAVVESLTSVARQLQASAFSRFGTKTFTLEFVEPLLRCLSRTNTAYCTGYTIHEQDLTFGVGCALPRPKLSTRSLQVHNATPTQLENPTSLEVFKIRDYYLFAVVALNGDLRYYASNFPLLGMVEIGFGSEGLLELGTVYSTSLAERQAKQALTTILKRELAETLRVCHTGSRIFIAAAGKSAFSVDFSWIGAELDKILVYGQVIPIQNLRDELDYKLRQNSILLYKVEEKGERILDLLPVSKKQVFIVVTEGKKAYIAVTRFERKPEDTKTPTFDHLDIKNFNKATPESELTRLVELDDAKELMTKLDKDYKSFGKKLEDFELSEAYLTELDQTNKDCGTLISHLVDKLNGLNKTHSQNLVFMQSDYYKLQRLQETNTKKKMELTERLMKINTRNTQIEDKTKLALKRLSTYALNEECIEEVEKHTSDISKGAEATKSTVGETIANIKLLEQKEVVKLIDSLKKSPLGQEFQQAAMLFETLSYFRNNKVNAIKTQLEGYGSKRSGEVS